MNADSPRLATVRLFPWLFALFAAGLLFVLSWAVVNEQLTPLWLAVIAGVLGVLLFFGEYVTLTFDHDRHVATLTQRRVWRVRRREIRFDEVHTVAVDESRSTDGSGASYRALMVLKSGEQVPLTSQWITGRRGAERLVKQIAEHFSQSRFTPIEPALDGRVRVAKEGETAGVPWQVEMFTANDNTPVTRWFSIGDRLPDGFLLLIPAASGAKPAAMPASGLMASAARFMYRQYLKMLYLQPEDLPGLDQAVTLPNIEARLAAHYTALTSNVTRAAEWLNQPVGTLLLDWQQRNPLKTNAGAGMPYVVITPRGLWVIFFRNCYQDADLAQIAQLGAGLVRAHRNSSQGD
jgi:hypothetical protein